MNTRYVLLFCTSLIVARCVSVPLSVHFVVYNEECGNINGRIDAQVSGGTYPYTYAWETGGTTETITGLAADWYTLTITDAALQTLIDSAQVINMPNIDVPADFWFGGVVLNSQAGLRACLGMCNGGTTWSECLFTPNVIQPVTYSPTPFGSFACGPTFSDYCDGAWPVITVTDNTGCTGSFPVSMIEGSSAGPMQLISTQPACGPTGSVTFDVGNDVFTFPQGQLLDASFAPYAGGSYTISTWGQLTFNNLPPGDYHIERTQSGTTDPCLTYLDFTIADLGANCGVVSGDVFLDHDHDCVMDLMDEAIPNKVLEVLPGPFYTITDGLGHYDLGLPFGSYTIDQQAAADLIQNCPGTDPTPFTLDGATPAVAIDFGDSSAIALDLVTVVGSTAARPGFEVHYGGIVTNESGQLSGPVDVTFTFDPLLTFLSAMPAPSSVVGSTVTWAGSPGFGAFAHRNYWVHVAVPPDPGLIGTAINATLNASQPLSESSLANNAATTSTIITGSFDPNEKIVEPRDQYVIGVNDHLDYTIRFQNTGTDTAFDIVVVDTLPAEVDPLTFVPGASSHPYEVGMSGGGIVRFTFDNILLADSNTNEAASHGFITFHIEPREPLLPGTMISNAADILFDFNPAIRTDTAAVITEFSTRIQEQGQEQLRVFPDPADDRITIASAREVMRSVSIIGTDGRTILRRRANDRSVLIDIADLAPGIYLVNARLANGTELHTRFIKH